MADTREKLVPSHESEALEDKQKLQKAQLLRGTQRQFSQEYLFGRRFEI